VLYFRVTLLSKFFASLLSKTRNKTEAYEQAIFFTEMLLFRSSEKSQTVFNLCDACANCGVRHQTPLQHRVTAINPAVNKAIEHEASLIFVGSLS